MPESLPCDAVTLTRRTTVAAVPFLALAACRWGPEDEESPEVERAQDADAGLVATVATAITRVSLIVDAVTGQHIGLAAALAPLAAMHAAHLQVLAVPVTTATIAPGELDGQNSRSALATIRLEEARLQTGIADLAATAVSGTLARALASMSASIAQHLAALPELARGPA